MNCKFNKNGICVPLKTSCSKMCGEYACKAIKSYAQKEENKEKVVSLRVKSGDDYIAIRADIELHYGLGVLEARGDAMTQKFISALSNNNMSLIFVAKRKELKYPLIYRTVTSSILGCHLHIYDGTWDSEYGKVTFYVTEYKEEYGRIDTLPEFRWWFESFMKYRNLNMGYVVKRKSDKLTVYAEPWTEQQRKRIYDSLSVIIKNRLYYKSIGMNNNLDDYILQLCDEFVYNFNNFREFTISTKTIGNELYITIKAKIDNLTVYFPLFAMQKGFDYKEFERLALSVMSGMVHCVTFNLHDNNKFYRGEGCGNLLCI